MKVKKKKKSWKVTIQDIDRSYLPPSYVVLFIVIILLIAVRYRDRGTSEEALQWPR